MDAVMAGMQDHGATAGQTKRKTIINLLDEEDESAIIGLGHCIGNTES